MLFNCRYLTMSINKITRDIKISVITRPVAPVGIGLAHLLHNRRSYGISGCESGLTLSFLSNLLFPNVPLLALLFFYYTLKALSMIQYLLLLSTLMKLISTVSVTKLLICDSNQRWSLIWTEILRYSGIGQPVISWYQYCKNSSCSIWPME